MDAGLEILKVMSCWENGRTKRVPVSDVIGTNELANAFVRLVSNLGVLNLRKSRISRK